MPNKPTPVSTPGWPWPDIVRLTAHSGSGQWRKRHKGKDYYFGKIGDPTTALANWRREWPMIIGGAPKQHAIISTLTMSEVSVAFMRAQYEKNERGELAWSSYVEYRHVANMVLDTLGQRAAPSALLPGDFAKLTRHFAKYAPVRRRNLVVKVRTIFNWAKAAGMIDALPDYGPEFKGPPEKTIRRHKREQGERWFSPAQLHQLMNLANPQMKAMILLGINCGIGNTDVAMLLKSSVNTRAKMLDYHRTKTEAQCRAPLWPETLAAIRRLDAHAHPHLFASASGRILVKQGKDRIGAMFGVLADAAGIKLRFYDLRRTFATVAANCDDEHARKIIMGHTIDGVHEGYIQRFPVKRLQKVSDHVRAWLRAGQTSGRRR